MTTTQGPKTYKNLLDVVTADYELQEGYEWGIRSVHPDLSSSRGFVWPLPGGWAVSPGSPGGPCPGLEGDGICTAEDWRGMASSGIPATTLLLTAHKTSDVLGRGEGKSRSSEIYVVALIDGARLVREHGAGANLYAADLSGANLSRADLSGANLFRADLSGANLFRANLSRADLSGASLYAADLYGANLSGANLSRADLSVASLFGANLSGADLYGANLSGANLYGVVGYVESV